MCTSDSELEKKEYFISSRNQLGKILLLLGHPGILQEKTLLDVPLENTKIRGYWTNLMIKMFLKTLPIYEQHNNRY